MKYPQNQMRTVSGSKREKFREMTSTEISNFLFEQSVVTKFRRVCDGLDELVRLLVPSGYVIFMTGRSENVTWLETGTLGISDR